MGLRKSASPCFASMLLFLSHSCCTTLMHLFICCGLIYSFEDIFFFHAQQPGSCFSTLHCYVAPVQICVHVCVCARAQISHPDLSNMKIDKKKKTSPPKSNYSSTMLCFWSMKYLYYEYDLFIYLSIYSFVYITLKEGKLEKLCL